MSLGICNEPKTNKQNNSYVHSLHFHALSQLAHWLFWKYCHNINLWRKQLFPIVAGGGQNSGGGGLN